MTEKKNCSIAVASAFFVLFLLFVLLFTPTITTNAVVSGSAAIYNFEQAGKVEFNIKQNQMNVKDVSDRFKINDYIWCLVYFDNNTLATKNGTLDIYFYSPDGLYKKFLDVTKNIANVSSGNVGGICDDSNQTICGAFYQVNESLEGDWKCEAVSTTSSGKVNVTSDKFFMINNAPVLQEDIPDLQINKNGSYDEIDMDEYFEDDDDLEFGLSGLKYLTAKFDSSNKLIFANPNKFEGVENISVRASDGYSVTSSNYFLVKVGNGTFVPFLVQGCISDWKTTSWSACIQGLQVRTVVDVNSCGVIIDKPAETQSCVEIPSDMTSGEKYQTSVTPIIVKDVQISSLVWVLLFLGIFVFIAVGIYYFINKFKRNNKDVQQDLFVNNRQEKVKEIFDSSTKNLGSNNELDVYIQKSLESKINISIIKQNLLNAGWDRKLVDEKIAFVQTKLFVKDKLGSGVDKEKLKQSFLLKGWKEEQIKDLFDE
jgi:hypothetical protein